MSELIQKHDNRATIRWKLLTSTSALVLVVSSIGAAHAEDTDRPLIWLELGGQAENVTGQGAVFDPPFIAANPDSPVLGHVTPLQAQQPAKFSFGENAAISFQPESSDWVFSAAIRYGRSSNSRHVDHQTSRVLSAPKPGNTAIIQLTTAEKFSNTHASRSESHAILDFSAGKDVGLGLFGKGGSSVLSIGVRFAQFATKQSFDIRARPDLNIKYFPSPSATARLPLVSYNGYHATGHASRSFHGVGPSLSWNGSAPFAGNVQDGELIVDWGVNGALLFGKQKAHVRHLETAYYHTRVQKYNFQLYPSRHGGHDNVRSVVVPNVGGSIGLSWRLQNFKVSFGYRADFFFGAIDGANDGSSLDGKNENLAFRGPYASISVGMGSSNN